MKPVFPIIALLLFLSCDSVFVVPETVYVISQGEHKSKVEGSVLGNEIRTLKSTELRFRAKFDASARYQIEGNDHYDINKLMGFSDCNSFHQDNSARIGWRYNSEHDVIELFYYVYQNKKVVYEQIETAEIGEEFLCSIRLVGNHYEFEVAQSDVYRVERGANCDVGLYYLLYPYFGGNSTAPHDIRIVLNEIPL